MTSREKGWLAALVVMALMALVEWFTIPGHYRLLQEINNAGHIPVFGILAVAMLHLVKLIRPSLRQNVPRAYLTAFALAVSFGALSELLQYYGPRDADPIDLARDLIGAASFLALYAAIRDPDLRAARKSASSLRPRLLAFSALLWLLGGWSLCMAAVAFAHRNAVFPVICDFDSRWSTRDLDPFLASVETGVQSDSVGIPARGVRLHFEGKDWPGVRVTDVYPDWNNYDSLVLQVCVEGNAALFLGLGVADQIANEMVEDRFSARFMVDPGKHHLAVSLGQVRVGPVHRLLDMSLVESVRIFTDSSGAGQSVLLETLYLK